MKLRLFILMSVLTVFISACGVYTIQNLKPSDVKSYVGQEGGFLYGTYTFSNYSSFLDGNVALIAGMGGKDDKEFYIEMQKEPGGSFLYFLKPGTYKITLMQYKNYWRRELYDSQMVSSTFTIKPNEITYLGSFATVADYDRTYINWGIKSVSDNADADVASIKKDNPSLNDLAVSDETAKDIHSVVILRYYPNSSQSQKMDNKIN